jgi:hypothetical protein
MIKNSFQLFALYSYLKQTKMSAFLLYKSGEQGSKMGPVYGVGTSGRGRI